MLIRASLFDWDLTFYLLSSTTDICTWNFKFWFMLIQICFKKVCIMCKILVFSCFSKNHLLSQVSLNRFPSHVKGLSLLSKFSRYMLVSVLLWGKFGYHSQLVTLILLKITNKLRKNFIIFPTNASTNFSKLPWLFSFSASKRQFKISFWIFLLEALTMGYFQGKCFAFKLGFHLAVTSANEW